MLERERETSFVYVWEYHYIENCSGERKIVLDRDKERERGRDNSICIGNNTKKKKYDGGVFSFIGELKTDLLPYQ